MAGDPPPTPRVSPTRALPYLLALLPLLYLVGMLLRYYVDVPVQDQWLLVTKLQKAFEGGLTLADLQAQHGEHRMLFPWLIMISLAKLTHWNTGYEVATTVLLALGVLVALLYQVRWTQATEGWPALAWHVPLLSLLVLSLGQGENWFTGWQLQFPLNVLGVTVGFMLLARQQWSLPHYVGGLLLGIVATYSLGNGPLFWPIAVLLVAVIPRQSQRVKWGSVLGVIVASAVVLGWYAHDYTRNATAPLTWPWDKPVLWSRYVLGYLGGPLSSKLPDLFGLGGVALLGGSLWVLLRQRAVQLASVAPFLALALYAMASGAGGACCRLVSHSFTSCASSRYQTISQLFWVAVIVLLMMVATQRQGEEPTPRQRRVSLVAAVMLVLLVLPLLRREVVWYPELRRQSEERTWLRELLLGPDGYILSPPAEYRWAVYKACSPREAAEVVQKRPFLIRHRLSLYRHALPTNAPPPPPSPGSGLLAAPPGWKP